MNKRFLVSAVWTAAGVLIFSGVARAADGPKEKIRVAVVGDSLSSHDRWPVRLAKHLGGGYEVKSFTANGLTVIPNVYRQIWNRYEYKHALDYNPNVVLLAFGANAGKEKPGQWRKKPQFIDAYKTLIGLYERLGTKPKIYLCLPTWPDDDYYGIWEKTVKEEVMPAMKQIAQQTGATFIDVNTPLKGRSDVMGEDHVYSTDVGNEIIARAICAALTAKNLAAVPVANLKAEVEPEGPPLPAPVGKMAVGDEVALTAADVANHKGDGADGKGNTPDDTWQFWFELAHGRSTFHRLDLATATMSPQQRQKGIPRKVEGPIAGSLPNPKDTEGWIFHSDWDGRYEGVWGDKKANQVLAHPYVEKQSHGALAITFRVPENGAYDVSGKVTDLQVVKFRRHTGILWFVEAVKERAGNTSPKADRLVGKGGPVGDKVGPDSQEFAFQNVDLKRGELLRLVIDPNNWWGTDLTRIDYFKIKRVK